MTTELAESTTIGSAGTGFVEWRTPTGGIVWTVQQVSCQLDKGGGYAVLTKNGLFISSTIAGNGDAADGVPWIRLTPSDVLRLAWTNAVPGAVATGVAQYVETAL